MQALVRKRIQMRHGLSLPHSVCGTWLRQQHKFVKGSHCSEEMSECRLSVTCIAPETRYKVHQSSYEVQVNGRYPPVVSGSCLSCCPLLSHSHPNLPSPHYKGTLVNPYWHVCYEQYNVMKTMSTHGMQTPDHLEFHAHVGYSGGELLT